MSYTICVKGGDGSISRERVRFPFAPPVNGKPAAERREEIREDLNACRAALRDKRGWTKGKKARYVASIPPEVYAHIVRNEGREAARDSKYLIRRSMELGIDPRVSKGRY